ncbi:hypothetical protein Tco_1163970 [Tanacetum coccineum]
MRCVMKSPEERPTMAEVVIELEKALRLQGGEVSDVYILGSGNGNGLTEGTVNVHDQEGDDTSETMSSYIAEDESKGISAPNENQTLVLQEDLSSSAPISDVIDAEIIDKSIINGENKDGNESTKHATSSETSNGYTGVSDQEAQNSGFLKSGSRNFDHLHHEIHAEVMELEDLRIPFDEIKFGKKIDMRSYGTLFVGVCVMILDISVVSC